MRCADKAEAAVQNYTKLLIGISQSLYFSHSKHFFNCLVVTAKWISKLMLFEDCHVVVLLAAAITCVACANYRIAVDECTILDSLFTSPFANYSPKGLKDIPNAEG